MLYEALATNFSEPAEICEDTDFEMPSIDGEQDIASNAQAFVRMCQTYETDERINFNLDSFGAQSVTLAIELLRTKGLKVKSLELANRKHGKRPFDSFIVLIRQETQYRFGARTASFRASMSYCRHA